jgi:cytochrome c oxidase subunit IV
MLLNENLRLLLFSSNLLICFLLIAMLLMVEIGWRIGAYLSSKYSAKKVDSSNTFLTAIFSLLALLIAFTFSGASDRFDHRRELIVLEVSAIGTAYQSIDLLSHKDQPQVKELFKQYLDSRINLYKDNETLSELHLEKKVAAHNAIGNQLWKAVVRAVEDTVYPQKLVAAQILPKVSDMFTTSENQRLASKFHPPEIIWQALLILSFIGSLVAGYNMGIEKKRDWLVVIIFSILMAGTIFIIFSLEYPRIGKVSLVDFEAELMVLRKSF